MDQEKEKILKKLQEQKKKIESVKKRHNKKYEQLPLKSKRNK